MVIFKWIFGGEIMQKLTEEEIEDVIEGKDIWLNSEEVMQRWHKRQEDTSLLKKAS